MERLKSCQKEKKITQVKRHVITRSMYIQIKKLIKKQRVRMIEKDNEDMYRLMNELTPHVENEFNKDSP